MLVVVVLVVVVVVEVTCKIDIFSVKSGFFDTGGAGDKYEVFCS